MELTKDYFKSITNKQIYELPKTIDITIIDNTWSNAVYDVKVKFVWENGVGYPEQNKRYCTYCSIRPGMLIKLPNGTEFTVYKGKTDLVERLLNAAGPELKLVVTDEVEFMDI